VYATSATDQTIQTRFDDPTDCTPTPTDVHGA
jgi:hypothetical protein